MSRLFARSPLVRQHPSWYFSLRFNSTVAHPFNFHIGVSWAPKPPDPELTRFHTAFSADSQLGKWRDGMLVHPKRSLPKDAGEDFFCHTEMRNGSGVAFGVADGVGGWVDSGVDPSLFAQALMFYAHNSSHDSWAGEPEIDPTQDHGQHEDVRGREMTPYECLDLAYHQVLEEQLVEAGSSTACLLTLNSSSGVLRSANLGDSGYLIIRSSSVIYREPAQTHYFNCPLQLTKYPESASFNKYYLDLPSAAAQHETKLRHGDIVIAYTDGLSDNVFPTELVAICSLIARAGGPEGEQVQSMANRIVQYAQACMRDRKRASPFERDAAREGISYRGGKVDDVTVVMALVSEAL
ncbi:phosphatase 2C-like domain-containing protein [Boletus edulis BED1]|uniref:Protein phosphatase n=1 Tax=Boletus edulis BED1 TaxID=1328754 RepID=A0AAD4GJU2_BOLED|nr:phosphatase 2C-like domain-containing protein [Boletus edulis BED1]